MGSIQYFNPGILNNPVRLKEFLKHNPTNEVSVSESYFGTWRLVWITAKAPFEALLAVVFRSFSYLTYFANRKISLVCRVIAAQMTRDWDQLSKVWHFGSKLITPTIYCPQLGTSDAYGQAPLPIAEIRNKEVKSFVRQEITPSQYESSVFSEAQKAKNYKEWIRLEKENKEATLDFFPNEGFYRGTTLLAIYYLLSSTENDKTLAVKKVAELFRTGFPRQATILNAFHSGYPEKALDLNKEENRKISLYELNLHLDKAKEKLVSLKEGVYQLNVLNHSLVYVKLEKEAYVFDLNFGLLKMTPEEMLNLILDHYHEKDNPDAKITITRFSKK